MRAKKQYSQNPFSEYAEKLTLEDSDRIKDFFAEFDTHCLMSSAEKKLLKSDFEKAILYYVNTGTPLNEILTRLDIKNLGGFYARPPILWFPLDDAAKIYPLSMEHGRMSMFRLSVYLKEQVVPELLQMALNFTIKRFPSFATTLKKGVFWHYLDTAKRRFSAERESDIPCRPLKVSRSGSQSFRVLYWNNRISVEFFHVLTDGTGGMTFLKALTAEYLRLRGVSTAPCGEIWDINETPSTEELENAFGKVKSVKSASGFVDKAAVQMSGRISKNKPCRVIHFKMDAGELKRAAERYNATVTVYLLALAFVAGKAATDAFQGEASIQVPVNMRKFYPSKTVRNFSMYCGIRLPIGDITEPGEIISEIGAQLGKKASVEAMSEMLTATKRLVDMLKYIPLAVKQPAARLVYGFLGDRIFTNTLSNLGVVKLPEELLRHIESMDFLLGTAITNRAGCAAVTVNGITTFSVTKMTVDPTFEEKFYELLTADGINADLEGSGFYET